MSSATAGGGADQGLNVSLTVNVVFRSTLCMLAAAVCWVPMRVLWKNGELAGTTFAIVTIIFNLYIGINAMIWHNDDTSTWWKGYGWCDLQVYTTFPLETIYAASVFAIIRHIANQVALLRVTGLSNKERRRKYLMQSLIIFTLPVIQLALMYLVLSARYGIMTVVGCRPIVTPTWVLLVFYVIPSPVFTILAVIYAVLVYIRYRQIDQSTREAIWNSSNSTVQTRSARTKRKLYFMAVCVIIPYAPIQITYFVINLVNGAPWNIPYSFKETHGPYYHMIPLITSDSSNPVLMYQAYTLVFSVVTIFLFFGRTKEAHDTYRRYLRFFGLGKIWPKLNEEWFPNNSRGRIGSTLQSWRTRISGFVPATSSGNYTRKDSLTATVRQVSLADGSTTLVSPPSTTPHSGSKRPDSGESSGSMSFTSSPVTTSNSSPLPQRNPWIFRTMPASTYPIRLPQIPMPSFLRKKVKKSTPTGADNLEFHTVPLESVVCSHTNPPPTQSLNRELQSSSGEPWARGMTGSAVRTKVWCPDAHDSALEGDQRPDSGASTRVLVQTRIDHSMEGPKEKHIQ